MLWSRFGAGYDQLELVRAISERSLVELRGVLRPAEDMALYGADIAGANSAAGAELSSDTLFFRRCPVNPKARLARRSGARGGPVDWGVTTPQVGLSVGVDDSVGLSVGDSVGLSDGDSEGLSLGDSEGLSDGDSEGDSEGLGDSDGVGDSVG